MPRKPVPSEGSDETRPLPEATAVPAVPTVPVAPLSDPAPADTVRTDTLHPETVPADSVHVDSVVADPVAPVAATPPPPTRGTGARILPFALGAAAVVLVILISGGTSWVVARAVAAQPLPAATSAPTSQHQAAGAQGKAGKHAAGGMAAVRGTIRTMDGSSWTVATMKGGTVDVTVTANTRYLDDGTPASTAAFHVGDTVIVAGTRSGTTLTATRVVARAASSTTPNS